jgi:hypothetical protein
MVHPYATIEFGDSLRHIGEPIYIPEWGTTVLRRDCGMEHHDVIGTYPITVFKPVVLVIENVLRPELADLQRTFDFARPFKLHYLHDRTVSPIRYSKHHRYEVRRAARALRVERLDLTARLDEWTSLYQGLVTRLGLANSLHAFPRSHHEALASLPGTAAIGAFANGRLVSCHVWVCHGGHAMSHLAASSEGGYSLRAAYAVNAASIELLTECRTLNFGGGAGGSDEVATGLTRFKQGFANITAPAYLCGKVLDAGVYAGLSRQAGVPADATFFPAYRKPVSQLQFHGCDANIGPDR